MIFNSSGNVRCHIELSDYCNAACPMCGRNQVYGKSKEYEMVARDDVDSSQLTVDDIKKIFDKRFFDTYNLTMINLCGNRGDPATATDLFEICEYLFSAQPKLTIKIATNGGLKTAAYWKKLGNLFCKYGNKSRVTFGIDGLEDTNHIYRQNVIFKNVMRNAQAFIDGGGYATWQYLIFKHNEHQVIKAKELSESMGFKKFYLYHTPRFASLQEGNGQYVFKYKGKTHILETADPEFHIKQETSEYIQSDDSDVVDCKSKDLQEFYIDSHGRLLPCCWLGSSLSRILRGDKRRDRIMHMYDTKEMNVIDNDLVDTLQHDWIAETVTDAWKYIGGNNCPSQTCKKYCSKSKNLRKARVNI